MLSLIRVRSGLKRLLKEFSASTISHTVEDLGSLTNVMANLEPVAVENGKTGLSNLTNDDKGVTHEVLAHLGGSGHGVPVSEPQVEQFLSILVGNLAVVQIIDDVRGESALDMVPLLVNGPVEMIEHLLDVIKASVETRLSITLPAIALVQLLFDIDLE